jgi:O-antigen ligase
MIRDMGAGGRSDDIRVWLWSLAWNYITDSPVLGMPIDRYHAMSSEGVYFHNLFLEQWNLAGLMGLVGSLVLVGAVFRAALRLLDAGDNRIFTLGMVHVAIFFGYLIQAQFSLTLYQGRMMFLAAGIIMGLDCTLRQPSAVQPRRRAELAQVG